MSEHSVMIRYELEIVRRRVERLEKALRSAQGVLSGTAYMMHNVEAANILREEVKKIREALEDGSP